MENMIDTPTNFESNNIVTGLEANGIKKYQHLLPKVYSEQHMAQRIEIQH